MNLMHAETLEKLRAAWERGLSTRAASREVGCNRNTCNRYFQLWAKDATILDPINRDQLRESAASPGSSGLFCIIQPSLKVKLIEAANERKTSLNHFVGFLLEVVIEDGLIPAIMEETGDSPTPEAAPVKRKCLCCASGFFSAHKYNRLCRECAVTAGDGPGDPAVDYVSNSQAIFENGIGSGGRMGGFVRK